MAIVLDISVEQKSFAANVVLDQVALALQDSEIVTLLGASGCGKSTLLRIAGGLDQEFSGRVLRAPELKGLRGEGVAFVFQEARLMPWLTVAQNIGFADGQRADPGWVSQLIDEVGLSGWEDALPKQLSGGMAQRVAIARGLYSRPRVLLLDEPFSAVDAFTRMKLQDLLLSLVDRHGIAVLLVTHDIDESVYLGDRVMVMGSRPGQIRRTLDVGLSRPRDRADSELARLRAQTLAELHGARAL